jgi:Uma2 family endonuclease
MDTLAIKPRARLTFSRFEAFRDARPEREKWELIDGEPIMMPPPSLVHQRISGNIERLIQSQLDRVRPEWHADQEIGLHVPEDEDWSPEPDVTVIDRDIALGQIYAERFYFVVEVLSSDRAEIIAKKRDYHLNHVHCRGCLFVSQKLVSAELCIRSGANSATISITDPDAVVDLPDIGQIGSLKQFYARTPLQLLSSEQET